MDICPLNTKIILSTFSEWNFSTVLNLILKLPIQTLGLQYRTYFLNNKSQDPT